MLAINFTKDLIKKIRKTTKHKEDHFSNKIRPFDKGIAISLHLNWTYILSRQVSSANQLTGFFMMRTSVFKRLKLPLNLEAILKADSVDTDTDSADATDLVDSANSTDSTDLVDSTWTRQIRRI